MGKRPHWPQHWTTVGNERMQNRRSVRVWDSHFSCLFVYVRGMMYLETVYWAFGLSVNLFLYTLADDHMYASLEIHMQELFARLSF